MKYLFIHQNYPGQFKHLAGELAKIPGNKIVALVDEKNLREASSNLSPGITLMSYATPRGATKETHRYLYTYESSIRRGQQIAKHCLSLQAKKFVPDIICAHAGWGEALFLKDIFPDALVLNYFEFFYRHIGADIGFDNEFYKSELDDLCRIKIRNSHHLMSLEYCDWGLTPTKWQLNQLPESYINKISTIHEGVNTQLVKSNSQATYKVHDSLTLSKKDKVITFVNRNLEPYRGFHIFMRSLPEILRSAPDAHVLIVGGDDVSYGARPKEGGSWRDLLLREMEGRLDMKRVHFLDKIPYEQYLKLLQISTVHVYLTYPFVLSWSMLESMAAECVLVASNTAPVTEVVKHEENGILVDFFDTAALAQQVLAVLKNPDAYRHLAKAARETILEKYDLKTVCLPQQLELLQNLPAKVGRN